MSEIHQDFEEFFASLRTAEVRWLLIGGVARNFYLEPRLTKDIDVWLEPERGNIERLKGALADFGFPTNALDTEALQDGGIVMLGRAPWRIDLLTRPAGLDFEACWRRSQSGHYGAVPIRLLSREDLIANKRAVSRPLDLLDIAELEALDDEVPDDSQVP